MSLIVDKLSTVEKLCHTKGCTDKQVKEAQEELKITFPEDYKDILKTYGAISFYGTEWTGLNVDEYINVVSVTKEEREINDSFPMDCFVLENQGIDGFMIICNEEGEIFSFQNSIVKKIYDNIDGYLDECMRRGK